MNPPDAPAVALLDRPSRALCPLAMHARATTDRLVGRAVEVSAIRQEIEMVARGRLACVSIEGEPGIGKTRLLLAAQDLAVEAGLIPVAVAADEELRGPFLLARSILGCRAVQELAATTPAGPIVQRALDAVSGREDPAAAGMAPTERLLHTYDLTAMAMTELAAHHPLMLVVDDIQWADADSLGLLRYVIRSNADAPILLLVSMRPEETATVDELVTLLADVERRGLLRRLRPHRFGPSDSAELVAMTLAGRVDPVSAATIHAQAEGVPFIVEELARAYHDAGMIRQIDGAWTLGRNASRLMPSAVHTLIQRRAAGLPDATRALMADAGVLGRSFSLRDLRVIIERLGAAVPEDVELSEILAPAVRSGLLVTFPEGEAADYAFPHEQVRDFVIASLTTTRRRRIHSLIVELLSGSGDPSPESLSILAFHAQAAGDGEASGRFAIAAAREALGRHAPEEALRSVEIGLPVVSDARDRVSLLLSRDDALAMLHRPGDRLESLAELTALADALDDPALRTSIPLRRSAALRESGDEDAAADVARSVRARASAAGDRGAELAALLELGQALLRSPLGEAYVPVITEIDADGAETTFAKALELAEDLGDDAAIAAASRELGVVAMARVRAVFVDMVVSGDIPENLVEYAPLGVPYMEALGRFQRAIEVYDRLGDRRGLMSSILGLAYASWGTDFKFSGAIRRLEEIRRLTGRVTSLATESERATSELHLLYGIHVYAREFGHPDLALSRGEAAYRSSRAHGDRSVEFLAAGGMAMTNLQVGDLAASVTWLDRAAEAAAASPTPLKARRLETWRGRCAARANDGAGLRSHLARATQLAADSGSAAVQCEALAWLAIEAAGSGAEAGDEELLAVAVDAADRVIGMADALPGHPPWRARANAALAHVRSARGDREGALDAARAALRDLRASEQEELFLGIWLPCARAVLEDGEDDEAAAVRDRLLQTLGGVAEHTTDDLVRQRWFAIMPQAELVAMVGGIDAARLAFRSSPLVAAHGRLPAASIDLDEHEQAVLRLMTEALSDGEIATTLGISEEQVSRQIGELMTRLKAPSRAAATAFVLLERIA